MIAFEIQIKNLCCKTYLAKLGQLRLLLYLSILTWFSKQEVIEK